MAVMMGEMAPAVVFLHGFTRTGASWDPVIARLPQRYRAIAPDLRGHGAAAAVQPVHLDGVVGDLERLAPARFTLVGYSMGGRIALHAALALAHRVNCLILIGASPGVADPADRLRRRRADERLADEFEHLTIESLAARWAQNPVLADAPDEVTALAHADRLRNTPEGLARALRGLGTGALPALWDRLGELAVPVALVAGERDEKFVDLAREMASSIARATVKVVPGAGHAVHLEAPEVVAALIGDIAGDAAAQGPDLA